MEKRRLGRSDLEVSVISLGCWVLGGDSTWGAQDEKDSIATVHAAMDAGINFFDTAEVYSDGRSEEILGKALAGRRDRAIVASKVSSSNLARQDLITACENSLRRLGTDYLDVYYIHWPSADVPIEESLRALEDLKTQGKIRVLACSNFGTEDLSDLLSKGRVEANQLAYNALFRAIEFEIQDICAENEIGITCYSPLAQGLLTGKFRTPDEVPAGRARTRHFSSTRPGTRHGEPGAEEEMVAALARISRICAQNGIEMGDAALAWLVAQKGVVSVIAGARTPEQALSNARAADVILSAQVLRELNDATEAVKAKLGPNPDMWQSESRIR